MELDKVIWSHTINGIFSPKSFRTVLEKFAGMKVSIESYIWKGITPTKVELFCWKALKGSILVTDVL